MATSLFMKIESIKGLSSDANHEGWIELTSMARSGRNNNRMGDSSNSKLTTRTAQLDPFVVSKESDITSPSLQDACHKSTSLGKVIIQSCFIDGGQLKPFVTYELEDCIVNSYDEQYVSEHSSGMETYTLVYNKLVHTVESMDAKAPGKRVASHDLRSNKSGS
ncbi:type VI secretion system tube protein Hcp [Salmonella enterica]|uniref:Type VI secretion system tube protein Hcp n=1 Tax=Salmonella enterica TaxID=28901 RepID=A0A3F3I8T6_SALER|nr:type VI secretion system tube protein Hcp [Salmonella enterica]EDQ9732045.1 type VI secretion system tube protein Hcp [Salmonella enterica subsp. enterica]EAQ8164041.1 type VI secretion system tube protein Hcp [Salmonella enterica]EAU2298768.1 type VI secretion system tube protein Hcp [Salmonella enterica]EBI9056977.1 Hcp1 family type VI secretion system effector [Salmonella enterica]EBN7971024.1 Hcp1 family type VI secretion system effector [Salmonella enterica]